jgi:hypothetical protein
MLNPHAVIVWLHKGCIKPDSISLKQRPECP